MASYLIGKCNKNSCFFLPDQGILCQVLSTFSNKLPMSNCNVDVCPVCQVQIEGGDKVLFSYGPVGTRARLWARVCQYAKKSGCINQNKEAIGPIKETDFYLEPPALSPSVQEEQRKAS